MQTTYTQEPKNTHLPPRTVLQTTEAILPVEFEQKIGSILITSSSRIRIKNMRLIPLQLIFLSDSQQAAF
jgi:hypothetical protein